MTIDGIELRAASARRVGRRCLRLNRTAAESYRKVIGALHRTACEDGLCFAYNLDIADEAGLSPGVIRKYLAMAESDAVVRTFRKGLICRVMVLLDHPRARRNVAVMRLQSGERDPWRPVVRTTGPGG